MARTIVHDIVVHEHGGRFLQQTGGFNSGVWVELRQQDAREKVRYFFRDAVESRRKGRPRALLAKVPISVSIDREDTFGDLLGKLCNDSAVSRYLAASKEITMKEENVGNKCRASNVVATKRPRKTNCSLLCLPYDFPFEGCQEEAALHGTVYQEGMVSVLHPQLYTHVTEDVLNQALSPTQDDSLTPMDPWKEDGFEKCAPDMGEELLEVLQQVDYPHVR